MSNAPFPVSPELTAIAMGYTNQTLISDLVLPRKTVGSQEFTYLNHNKEERFTIPNTLVGRKGSPDEVEFGATDAQAATVDHGLDDVVPQSDIDKTTANWNPLGEAVEGISELIALAREKRVADAVFNPNNYVTNQKVALSGTSQWSDYANSDPLNAMLTAMDAMIMRPNVAVIGRGVFTKLRMHPKVAKASNGNSGDTAIVARQVLAELLELEEVIVGESWYNTAAKGQAASFSRLWGNYCALLHRNMNANTRRGITYGMTAQWGDKIAGNWEEKNGAGLRGGQRVRAGESVIELITAKEAGYLFSNVI